jgi:hypothetical protein
LHGLILRGLTPFGHLFRGRLQYSADGRERVIRDLKRPYAINSRAGGVDLAVN